MTTSDANEIDADYIDRTDFDSHYGTDTAVTSASGTSADSEAIDTSEDDKSYAGYIIGGILIAAAAAGGVTVYIRKKSKN